MKKLTDPCKPVERRKKRSSNGGIFLKKIMDIPNRRRVEVFFRKKLNTCENVNRRKNIEQTQFNKSFADFKCKSLIKSNLVRKKALINSHVIFNRNFPLSYLIVLWTEKKS